MQTLTLWRGCSADDPVEVINLWYLGDGRMQIDMTNRRTGQHIKRCEAFDDQKTRELMVLCAADLIDEGWTLL